MLVTKEKFRTDFKAEHKKLLLEGIHAGLSDYDNPKNYSAEARRVHTPGARAINRHCHIVSRMEQLIIERQKEGKCDIRALSRRGRMLYIFGDRFQFSIKKFDGRLRTASIPTQQATDFKAQLPLSLDMPEELSNVFAGYKYDLAESGYEIYITCPDDEENYWVWKIAGAEIKEFFSNSSVDVNEIGSVSVRKPRVRIRPDVQRKVEANGNE